MEINKIQHNQPNFQALKSLKYRGLYKKYPEQAKKLKQAFMNNKIAMDFCKTYDVDVSIGAKKHGKNILSSYIRLDFINPIKPKLFGILNILSCFPFIISPSIIKTFLPISAKLTATG